MPFNITYINVKIRSPVLKFTKITGDNLVPTGKVSLLGYLDQEIDDKNIGVNKDEVEKQSSENNLPWPLQSETRPLGKTYAGHAQWAYVVSCYLF